MSNRFVWGNEKELIFLDDGISKDLEAIDLNKWLEKQKEGLIPKKVLVHRGPKIFQAIRWVKPNEEEHIEEEDVGNEEWADIEIYGEKLT